ncbi:MAG: DUF4968 domain-containing protein [Bacteroides sp.]|nr:DUF4968 domain-containing protein [Bacteroides sp.]
MRKIILLSVICTLSFCMKAQGGDTPALFPQENEVFYQSGEEVLRIRVCSERMIRFTKNNSAEFSKESDLIVVRKEWDPVLFAVEKQADHLTVTTDILCVEVSGTPLRVTISNKKGEVLYQEYDHLYLDQEGRTTPRNVCNLFPEDHFFGFGERMDALDQRGRRLYLNCELGKGPKPAVGGKDILRANYCPVPFFMNPRGYGLFLHTAFPTEWDLGWENRGQFTYGTNGGTALDYYFIHSEDMYTLLSDYNSLTGSNPMLPKPAYGLHVGTYSGGTWKHEEMTSDTYPVELCRRLRAEGIPFDLLWLDSTWRYFNSTFGNGGASFEWRNTFKDPQAMIDSIYSLNVSMIGLHIRAIMDNGTRINLLDEARRLGHVHPEANVNGVVNFFRPETVDWWWDNAVMRIASMGIKFLKTDCGGVLRFTEEARPVNGFQPAELHNLFPIAYTKAPYLKFQEHNNQRGLNHTREGYAGVQRYPFIWAGDWGSEWQWFEPVIRGELNMAMSGIGYWSHCMGGFEQYSPHDTDLYNRWVQFGMLNPVSVLFGMDHPRYHEPWTYGEEAMQNFIKYDSLRYALLPYMYSNAYRLYQDNRPVMSALVMDYPKDENTYRISDQYMFGPSMMVCPVTTKGALSRPVYFPGGEWYDFWTGEFIRGRQYKSFLTPPDLMPIFIKAGAIIPMQETMQYVGEKPVERIELFIFPWKESSYQLYEDDGTSTDYLNGVYSLTTIRSHLDGRHWILNIEKPAGNFIPETHSYSIRACIEFEPQMVTENGKVLSRTNLSEEQPGWYYDAESNQLFILTETNNRQNLTIEVR